jgi:hypothetical protein
MDQTALNYFERQLIQRVARSPSNSDASACWRMVQPRYRCRCRCIAAQHPSVQHAAHKRLGKTAGPCCLLMAVAQHPPPHLALKTEVEGGEEVAGQQGGRAAGRRRRRWRRCVAANVPDSREPPAQGREDVLHAALPTENIAQTTRRTANRAAPLMPVSCLLRCLQLTAYVLCAMCYMVYAICNIYGDMHVDTICSTQ